MSLIVNGVEVQAIDVVQGGVTTVLDKFVCNGVTVWEEGSWKTTFTGSVAESINLRATTDYTTSNRTSYGTDVPFVADEVKISGQFAILGGATVNFTDKIIGDTETRLASSGTGSSTIVITAKIESADRIRIIATRASSGTLAKLTITITKMEQYY